MFTRLFADSGLSLDRLRALVEVGAAGNIIRAAAGDPVRQSQYSRQIKELEDFFRVELVERHGKGIRLTSNGKELARISRFFLLGLSNFQRGCLTEGQVFRIGASATFVRGVLVAVLSDPRMMRARVRFVVETAGNDEVERRLHDLTLDFGVVTVPGLSRPLQTRAIGEWELGLWVPKALARDPQQAVQAFRERRLPLALPVRELPCEARDRIGDYEASLACEGFLEARAALDGGAMAAVLPDARSVAVQSDRFWVLEDPELRLGAVRFLFAWNPRLLRLNPHASVMRDLLIGALIAGRKTPCLPPPSW